MSVRRAVARPADGEDLAHDVGRYERSSLPEPTKVALRLADAFLTQPAALADAVKAQAREAFAPEQIVELVLKFVFALVNKPNIALGFDAPVDDEHLSTFVYDAGGRFVVDGLGAINASTG
jgi:hypothetical protein